MKQVKEIILNRAEGCVEECGEVRLRDWRAAEMKLAQMALTAPNDGSYDKVDFVIIWEDDYKYKGRFDLQFKHAMRLDNLEQHVKRFLNYLIKHEEEYKEDAKEVLEKYQIGIR